MKIAHSRPWIGSLALPHWKAGYSELARLPDERPRGWELDALKAFARGLGLEPEKVLTQAALAEQDN